MFFLEQWKNILPTLKVILLWRPAVEVCDSLKRRSRKTELLISRRQSAALWKAQNQIICAYKQKYPDDTVLLPISNAIKNDRNVLDYINNKFDIDLKYHSIDQIFDPTLFKCNPEWDAHVLSLLCGNWLVERDLRRLSDDTTTLRLSQITPADFKV